MSGLVAKLKSGIVDPGAAIKRMVVISKIKVLVTHPFTGCRLLRMKVLYTTALSTCGVDGTHLFVNPDYFSKTLDKPKRKGVLWHEGAHVWMMHHLRRGDRDPHFYNLAGDGVINYHAIKEGFELPENHISFASLRAQGYDLPLKDGEYTTDSLYDALIAQGKNPGDQPGKNDGGDDGDDGETGDQPGETGDDGDDGEDGDTGETGETGDGEGADTGETSGGEDNQGEDPFEDVGGTGIVIDAEDDDGESLKGTELAQAQRELAGEIFNDAQNAKSRGKLPGSIAEYVDSLRDAVIDWREKLARFFNRGSDFRSDPNRIDKKAARRGLFLSRRVKEGTGTVVVGVDTSASVSQHEYKALMAELKAICTEAGAQEVIVLYADTSIRHIDIFEDPSEIEERDLGRYGGGGTDFQPVFDYVYENEVEVDTLVYLTDLECRLPEEPDYPVLWVSTTDAVASWGETIRLDSTG